MTVERNRHLVIVGGGTAGWMTAALFSRMFGKTLRITLIESDAIAAIGVGEATIPPIQIFNEALKFDENDFIRSTQGTIKLGVEFQGWGKEGDRYMHAFGSIGHPHGLSPFLQYYLRARAEGYGGSLWDYSLNYLAARAGKFAPLTHIERTPLPGLNYAFHFDASLYARYLRNYAEKNGVERVEGKIVDVALNGENGFIETLTLESGRTIGGDVFIDCSGFRALLIGDAMGVDYVDWSHWLPCDRAIAVQTENVGEPRPYTQSIAHMAGWQWRIPLQHRTGNGHVFCSAAMSEDEATAILLGNLEGPTINDPRTIRFKTGRRAQFWVKNCVAIGLSSGFLEPIESTSIHLIQSAAVKFANLFPNADFDPAGIAEYNAQVISEFEGIRDFIIAHYHLNQRSDSSFWAGCRDMTIPETLSHRIDLYRRTGRLFREQNELFHEVGWMQLLIGQNIMPEAYDHMAEALPSAELKQYLADIHTLMNGAVARMPSHADWLARHCAATPVAA